MDGRVSPTVAAAVLVSLFVSFALDPMLSSRWYDPARRIAPAIKRWRAAADNQTA
jgi:multidrug efflux pump subunit AcrB